jgi:hypothetical protein
MPGLQPPGMDTEKLGSNTETRNMTAAAMEFNGKGRKMVPSSTHGIFLVALISVSQNTLLFIVAV